MNEYVPSKFKNRNQILLKIPFVDLRKLEPYFKNCNCCDEMKWKRYDMWIDSRIQAYKKLEFLQLKHHHDTLELNSTIPFVKFDLKYGFRDRIDKKKEELTNVYAIYPRVYLK